MDSEADAIVKDFASILEELTFNSRPIITTLTKMAEENISYAQYFVDSLESRIEKCVPKQKLYAFYTLDSICKNAGSPYTIYFSRNLFQLYKKTYLLVDNNVRQKLISMFKTWMAPNESTGLPLFDKSALDKIEQFLIKASALHQKNFQSMLPTPTVPLLLKEIDKLNLLTTERLKEKPDDEKLNIKLVVLSQLKQELQKEKLTTAALKPVQMQLMQVFAQDQQLLQERLRQEQYQKEQQQLQKKQNQFNPLGDIDQQQQRQQGSSHNPLFGNSLGLKPPGASALFPTSTLLTGQDFSEFEKASKLSKLHKLYESLESEGLVYKPPKDSVVNLFSTFNKGHSGASEIDADSKKAPLPSVTELHNILSDCKAYFATVNIDILNTPSLQISQKTIVGNNEIVHNNLINTLYRSKPKKCNVCGKRFGNSLEERRLQSDHLDWHFRINKRIKGSENTLTGSGNAGGISSTSQKNIQSRNWYLHDSQWVIFKDDEIVSTSNTLDNTAKVTTANVENSTRAISSGSMYDAAKETSPNTSERAILIDENLLRKKYVVVPESSEDMSFQCPICKETVSALYDEDLGEWTWKGSMEYNGKYFHAICYYEAAKNNNNSIGLELDLEKLKNLISE
ncbi:hypothetical protein Kpol_269p3 [Vanderwaltozyma polyspora DSM 70294]|uniref:CID domain-containing protein n=1 Tax=Vanderwaltozyma polyspora (strain ATCC 22028 / DSM 70294 / BCRC 21397 / CBS 2163 / NBRC 10782 / NRRL Y-8283 / UCD 57-17) TaxID=436907 RepID=A7TT34_VANPO|nr:uncharacterized protein Kpol_269p3 [Vanderwaltozyma polyspora DSM 70294]EDO14570.1 hypothetical protein Kpol_269p3 [Vanderwaltozyma polyspora DSM 70294]